MLSSSSCSALEWPATPTAATCRHRHSSDPLVTCSMRMSEAAGNELAELLWENRPALRRTTAAPHFFPPFACIAAAGGTSRAEELAKRPASAAAAAMRDLLLPVQADDDAVPWLHYPITDGDDDDDCDTAPLPPEYCSGLLSGYADLPAPAPAAVVMIRDAGASSTSNCPAVVPSPQAAVPKQPHRPSGEGVMNFTFFSRPLQRPPASAACNAGVESTVVQTATDRLRSTPLFSEQRMAWLQPPPKVAAAPPPPAPLVPVRQREPASVLPLPQQRLQPEPPRAPEPPPPPPPAATATTSSVCSDNGDRSQLKRSSHHHPHHHHAPEWSVSQDDEDFDDEAGAPRRSAARSTKRGRTAEVHNMSERRRRDRINEKMRALQELIPNCNKIDKASMLEEAIEYLKTLQLQVQMMSMAGTGLCVPPMLLPAAAAAMQHLQMPPMAHFHHHHLGAMGLAAGFGMPGAFDPRVAAQFPFPMIPGAPPMFAMPSPAPGAHMAVGTAAAQAEQTPSNHPPRAM